MSLYRQFNTQEEIDDQYNLGAKSTVFPGILDDWIRDSEQTRSDLDCVLDVAFGPKVIYTLWTLRGKMYMLKA